MTKNIRPPAVAGAFYPSDARELETQVRGFIAAGGSGCRPAAGVLAPHAGWYYSGHVAGAVFAAVDVPSRIIMLGPNHRGAGAPLAVDPCDGWLFPYGETPLDRGLRSLLMEYCPELEEDGAAHAMEHSLEVIVPFLWAKNRSVSIAPVCVGTHRIERLESLAAAVARAARETGAMVVASTDMTHYLPDVAARKNDARMIEAILSMEPLEIISRAESEGSLCGAGPVYAAVSACGRNGATTAKLVKYATSGDIGGERDAVVGYGGFVIS